MNYVNVDDILDGCSRGILKIVHVKNTSIQNKKTNIDTLQLLGNLLIFLVLSQFRKVSYYILHVNRATSLLLNNL